MRTFNGANLRLICFLAKSCHRSTLGILFLLLACVGLSNAQGSTGIRVCVGLIDYNVANQKSLTEQQARALSNHKPDKLRNLKVEGVTLLQTRPEEGGLDEEAHLKKCAYVVLSSVVEDKTAMGDQTNVYQQATPGANDPYQRKQDREYYVRIAYTIQRIDSTTPVAKGVVSTHDAAPEVAVISSALDIVANQVFAKVVKDIPTPTP